MTILSIWREGEELSEYDKFLQRFESLKLYEEELNKLLQYIEQFGNYGAREERFRPEGPVHALPKFASDLRLYCLRITDRCLLFGNGGIKSSQKVQDSPDCEPHRQFMIKVEQQLTEKLNNGEFILTKDNEITAVDGSVAQLTFGDC